jgi:hypothetical protein
VVRKVTRACSTSGSSGYVTARSLYAGQAIEGTPEKWAAQSLAGLVGFESSRRPPGNG